MEKVGYSDAAKLFAQNEGVVRAMEKKFYADLDEFWTKVLEGVLELEPDWSIGPTGILTKSNPPNWFEFRRKSDTVTRTFFWLSGTWYSPSIITDGVVRLECAWDKPTPHQIAVMSRRGPSLLPNCRKGKGTASCLFIANIECKEGSSIRDIANAIAELVRAVHGLADQALADAEADKPAGQ